MSAIFYAAEPEIDAGRIKRVRNIDIAPTILRILGVRPAATVEGDPVNLSREWRSLKPRLSP